MPIYLKYFYACLLIGLWPLSGYAHVFELNEYCQKAYDALMDLRITEARKWIDIDAHENPDNLFNLYLENTVDCIILYLEERQDDFDYYNEAMKRRLERIEKEGNPDSPYYLFCQAEIKLQSALIRIKFEEYFTAAWEVRKGYLFLEENQKKFPDFYPNYKSLGYLHACIGTVPDSYQWVLNIMGLSGSISQGMNEVQTFLNHSQKEEIFHKEAELVYCFFLIFLDTRYEEARQWINNELEPEQSLLDAFIASNIFYRLGYTDLGIQILNNRPTSSEYYHLPFLEYMLGILKFYRQDEDASIYINNFLRDFKGRHYIKDAYQKLAWAELIEGDTAQYHSYMNRCLKEGYTFIDNDKKAKQEAQQGIIPNVELLKARLLFDGGYFQQSLDILQKMNPENLPKEADKLEYRYRMARNYEGLMNWDHAIDAYKNTIAIAGDLPLYFAPKSALQLGIIYERDQQLKLAQQYYKKALSYKKHSYKNSLDQQAKAGLNRLKNR